MNVHVGMEMTLRIQHVRNGAQGLSLSLKILGLMVSSFLGLGLNAQDVDPSAMHQLVKECTYPKLNN